MASRDKPPSSHVFCNFRELETMASLHAVWPADKLLVRQFHHFGRATSGAVLPIFGLMFISITALVGLAVDVGRWVGAKDQTISAADAAVLAAGRALQTNGGDKNAALLIARNVYQEATKDRDATIVDNIDFEIVDDGMAVTTRGNANIKTRLMGILGVHHLPIFESNGTDKPKAKISIGQNSGTNVEVSMMLDVSGSMCNNPNYDQPCSVARKLDAMKDAAADLVNIVVWENQSKYTSRVSVVPFSGDVRPPAAFLEHASNKDVDPFSRSKTTVRNGQTRTTEYYFAPSPCLAERGGDAATSDMAPSDANPLLVGFQYVNSKYAASASCSIHSDAEIMPMTYDKGALIDRIMALKGQGGTAGHVGVAWSYYMLSPKWNSQVPLISKAAPYGSEETRKVAVLMSDGEYNFTYDADHAPSSTSYLGSGNDGSGSLNQRSSAAQAISICDAMKNDGIEIYTVGFELGGNQTAIDTLHSCATSPDTAYNADNGEELKSAFRDIALQISKLYLAH